ncbi:uncharacterized protein HGUI_01324 [Hanseniaspora guilliermondii]|uniref:Uncharacterized protein n=1 Tax=Hanseniaspora guilliermondii TaxID=56406 RepID=A0A1L0B000_9ASCO|nr:uncharacterized protein HGUI_01324 [Hanseniaspora guilliermondii]
MALPKALNKSQQSSDDELIIDPNLAISNKSVLALLNHMKLDYKKKKQEYKEKLQTFKMNEFGNIEQDEAVPVAPKSKVNVSFIINIQSAASLKSPVPNIPLSRYHRIPMVIKVPNRISKLGQDKILFIVKDPGDVYTEKLSACDQYLDNKLKVNKKDVGNKEVGGWRERLQEKKGKITKIGMKRTLQDEKVIDMNKNSSTRLTETSTELFSRVYGVKQLKQLKANKQLAKTLASFDVILLDHRVGEELRKKILTTTVIRHRKQPYTIKLYDPSKENIEKKVIDSKRQKLGKGYKIEKAEIDYIDPEYVFNQVNSIVRNTSVVIPWIATSLNKYDKEQRTGNTISLDVVCFKLDLEDKSFDINEATVIILENCKAIMQYLVKNLIKNKKYIISNMIKTGESQSLPMDNVDSILKSYY